ncbi:MAG: hypothetical protein JNL97_11465 [Verrucomicrobiales bacterium]|nr:hypothetical protein [Verrucomicrobiales bacterium]
MTPNPQQSCPRACLRSPAYRVSYLGIACLLQALFLLQPDSAYPASPHLQIVRRGDGFGFAWAGSRIRPDGTEDRPWFEIQHSTDLVAWPPVGQRIRGTPGGADLEYVFRGGAPGGFYRVLAVRPAASAAPVESGAEVFGFGAAFEAAQARIGPIAPADLAKLHPSGADYRPRISWDPTTARFWDQFDADPVVVNQGKTSPLPESAAIAYSNPRLESGAASR